MESVSNEPAMVALADDLDRLPRNRQVGYQGELKLKKVISIPIFEGEDGKEYVMDLAQAADGKPDLAAREWITVRGGQAGGRELVRTGNPKVQGPFDVLKALAGGGPLGDIAVGFLEKLLAQR